jgi:diacylglycerol O-acyltransferase
VAEQLDAAGMPTALGPVDYLLHRGEANPRTRSGIMALEILDTTPDWDRFRTRFENASRRALRLRQKVVVPTLPTAAPRWVVDPDFNLDYHVRRLRVPEPGTLRQVFDLAELMLQSPLDIARPLWTATLIEGLPDGKAATLLHLSHAVTDGVGSVEMFAHIYDLERDPAPQPTPTQPIPQDLTANDLMREGLNHLAAQRGLRGLARVLSGSGVDARASGSQSRQPRCRVCSTTPDRAHGWSAGPPNPLRCFVDAAWPPAARRSTSRFPTCTGPRKPAAARSMTPIWPVCPVHWGATTQALGVPISTLPMAVPVSLRVESDAAGGNRFTGVNLAAPIGTADPVARMQKIRLQMTQRRDEPAMDIIGSIAPVLSVLPGPLLESMTASVVGSDVQASNVPVYPGDTFLAGAKILRQYGIGPLPGVAMMVVLISRGGYCTITTRYDRAAIRDEALFARCLLEGFNEILTLAGDPAPRAVPATFDADTSGMSKRSVVGS